jgi:LmbE family N-acetylglucosaminyl deacetylase
VKDWSARHADIEAAMDGLKRAISDKAHPLVRCVEDYQNAGYYRFRLRDVRLAAILEVEVHAEQLWAHLSVSAPARVPSWAELRWAKEHFLGDRKAISVMPPRSEYINHHPHVLHLFASLERDPLPDFRARSLTVPDLVSI